MVEHNINTNASNLFCFNREINTGNANAGTGPQGMTDALVTCEELAKLAGVEANQVLPFSTGVIG